VGIRVTLNVELELSLFCLNRDLNRSSSRARYKIGPLVDDKRFANLIHRLEFKAIDNKESRSIVQQAVWDIAEDGKLRRATGDDIEGLPARR
jgi:hypothetical protein